MAGRAPEKPRATPEQLLLSWPPHVQTTARKLRGLILELCPGVAERAHPGWNILGYAYGKHPTWDMFCYVGHSKGRVQLGFNHGTALPDPQRVLKGRAKHARSLALNPAEPLPEQAVRDLIAAAYAYSLYLGGE